MRGRIAREVVRRQLWQAMSTGDVSAACSLVAAELDAGVTGTAIVTELLAPAQRAVGMRWQRAEWSVGEEHMATAVVDAALGIVEHNTAPLGSAPVLVAVVCAETEWHAMPARMFAQLLRERQLAVRFLGASQPADHLREHLARLQPDAVAVSASTTAALPGAARTLAAAAGIGVRSVAGGPAWGPDETRARRLGADAWAASVDAAVAAVRDRAGRPRRELERDDDGWLLYRAVSDRAPEALDAAYADLINELPGADELDEPARQYVRDALQGIADAVATTFLVDDSRVIEQHIGWLAEMLGARDVPRASVVAACLTLGRHLPTAAANALAASAATAYGAA